MGSPELLVVFWAHSRLPAATNPHRETAGRRSEQMGNLIQKEEDNDEEQPAMQQGKGDPAGPRPTASKPWVELNDPGNVMMTLGRRRVEWSVRMGVIYCLTMLYAVSEHVADSTVFGTWPILANFYGTFAIASSKRELKQLMKSDADVVYDERKGKLFLNDNGSKKGWGAKKVGGLVAKFKGKPELSADNFDGLSTHESDAITGEGLSLIHI